MWLYHIIALVLPFIGNTFGGLPFGLSRGPTYTRVTLANPSEVPVLTGAKKELKVSRYQVYEVVHVQDDMAEAYCDTQGVPGAGYVSLDYIYDFPGSTAFKRDTITLTLDGFCVTPKKGPVKTDFFKNICSCTYGHAFQLTLNEERTSFVTVYKLSLVNGRIPQVTREMYKKEDTEAGQKPDWCRDVGICKMK